jgi:squalene-hopene/tetraprenyl-beta-curcumene cyclase
MLVHGWKLWFGFVAFLGCGLFTGLAQDVPAERNLSFKLEIQNALSRGFQFLEKQQTPEGHWSNPEHPALTGLALSALLGDPELRYATNSKAVEKGLAHLLRNQKSDGGIYVRDLPNYNTSVSLMALINAGQSKLFENISKGRGFLVGLQRDFGKTNMVDTPMDGGVGYGSKYQHSDLNNTLLALETLHHSRSFRKETDPDLNWSAAIEFLKNCQNLPGQNKGEWVSTNAADRGGFVYYPGHSMAGGETNREGKVSLRSYGSASYAGLLAFIYTDLKKDDPSLREVLAWLEKNYTLKENPGMGQQGLFYYYQLMAKALSLSEHQKASWKNSELNNWRKDLAMILLNHQKPDGSWWNENNRWWEKDAVLTTSYALMALEWVYRGL